MVGTGAAEVLGAGVAEVVGAGAAAGCVGWIDSLDG